MEYVKKSGVLKVSYSLKRGPFEFRDENGKFSGIVADLFAQISELTGLKFEYRPTGSVGGISGDADILSSFQEDFDTARRMGFRLTSPYLRVPMVIVRKALADSGSKNMKTALPRYYYSYKNISGCSVVFYDDARSCLEAVKNGEVEQALLNSVYVEFMKQKSRYRNLWTSSTHDVNFEPCIAVRSTEDPRLLEILMKAVDNISPSEMNEILMNNVMENQKINLTSVIDSMPVDIVVFFSAFLLVMVIILLLLVRNRSIYAAKIRKMLDTDELTGVLSFVGFERMAKKILLQSDGSGKYFIVEFDVSRFRSYNALYGAKSGDGLLKAIASASVAALPKNSEIFARVYSDNFAVLLSAASVDDLKKRIIAFDSKLKSTVIPDMSVMLNYGIYEITDKSLSVREMVDCATMAKKTVKGNAEDIMGVYDCSLSKRQNEESSMISSMDSALKNREFVAFYQPKYDSVTREIVGAEALVRWRRPDGSMIMPDAFIGLFERNGQIIKLDHYMFETICAKQKQLIEQGAAALPIAVNFSKAHLYDRGFAECLSETADKAGIPKSLLEIEFTETAVTDETENALCSIRELKRAGFVLAMDDFGSGYSSLNTLKDLPFDVLKLDRGFLQMSSESGDRGRKIICGVIGMSKELSFKTVAEGVETEEQYDFLRDCGCDVIQGYYFSRPVDDDTYTAMLMEQSRKM